MKNFLRATLATAVLLSSTGLASAQDYRDEHNDKRHEEERRPEQRAPERHYQSVERHDGWRRGEPMRREDWDRGRHFDYRDYGLREPPYGYEWREVNGVFILGAIATGIIADILLAPR
jgi:Ni/Co efflux regulator RcnB